MSDEELIEKAARAAYAAVYGYEPQAFDPGEGHDEDWRAIARSVLAVFREHTAPTGDEREAADLLLASPVIRRIQAEALAQAAEVLDEPYRLWSGDYRAPGGRWERGPNVRLVDDPEESPRAESLGVADWLRNRADRIERGETA